VPCDGVHWACSWHETGMQRAVALAGTSVPRRRVDQRCGDAVKGVGGFVSPARSKELSRRDSEREILMAKGSRCFSPAKPARPGSEGAVAASREAIAEKRERAFGQASPRVRPLGEKRQRPFDKLRMTREVQHALRRRAPCNAWHSGHDLRAHLAECAPVSSQAVIGFDGWPKADEDRRACLYKDAST
jgi:hypothetical protein